MPGSGFEFCLALRLAIKGKISQMSKVKCLPSRKTVVPCRRFLFWPKCFGQIFISPYTFNLIIYWYVSNYLLLTAAIKNIQNMPNIEICGTIHIFVWYHTLSLKFLCQTNENEIHGRAHTLILNTFPFPYWFSCTNL